MIRECYFGVVSIALVLPIVGCGGSASAPSRSSGTARFTIVWPERTSRLIPEAASSIKIVLTGPTNTTKIIARPPSGTNTATVTIPDLEVGDYTAAATAFPNSDGTGTAQATGTIPLTIVKSQTTATSLTMGSTISSVDIRHNGALITSGNFFIRYGTTVTLTATAYNTAGQVVLVAPSQWEWSSNNTINFTLTPNGTTADLRAHNTYDNVVIGLKEKESGKLASPVQCNAGAAFVFDMLGHLPTTTTKLSHASGVSDDGTIVVGVSQSASPSGFEAFRWTAATGLTKFAVTTARPTSRAHGISGDGNYIVGESQTGSNVQGFRGTTTSVSLLGFMTGSGTFSVGQATTPDGGVIVGWGSSSSTLQAFRWTPTGGFVELGFLMSPVGLGTQVRSAAYAVSRDGSAVAGYSTSPASFASTTGSTEAMRWTQATGMVGLGDLAGGAYNGRAFDISADGKTVIGYSDSMNGREAFRWTQAEGMVGLGDLPGGVFQSTANGISSDGSIIVGSSTSGNGGEAFVWTANLGMRSINEIMQAHGIPLSGWSLGSCNAISADNRTIVGSGTHNGFQEAFRLYKSDGWDKP